MPGEDRKEAPTLRQTLRAGIPHAIERQIPSPAERNAMTDVLIAGSPEQIRLIAWNLAVALLEARNVINAMRKGVREGEIRPIGEFVICRVRLACRLL